ncbi:hypothetical protein Ahy_B03g067732 isoform B [Arachis hypogaea]|uniref:LysM domain-containing protein n=1 Tax=Arachis hypogaea TaxID=3818 RepID=A0A445A7N6_ARAHY|nr:hypothetical protein Ahy_B03g067732 isoform A [Arachis hypogaea]RYR22447.1 hypothetical protein Ahy_B03g067732 isoform B [Arachis hypogaea]
MEMFMWKETNGYHHDQFACGYGKKVPKMMSSRASPPIALGCIQHSISKMDTLAGIAIKYGVEEFRDENGTYKSAFMHVIFQYKLPFKIIVDRVLASASASASPDLRSSVITEARSEIHLSFPFTAATPSICLPGALNVAAVSEELAARQQDGDAGKPTGGDSPLEMEEKNGRRYLAMQSC